MSRLSSESLSSLRWRLSPWRSPTRATVASRRFLAAATSFISELAPTAGLQLTQQPSFEDDRDGEIAVAVVVEEDGYLVAVVAQHGSVAPAFASHPSADRVRLGRRHGRRGAGEVVVAIAARARVVLAEVGEDERAPAALVLRVPPHHVELGAGDFVLSLALGSGGGQCMTYGPLACPAHAPVRIPGRRTEICEAHKGGGGLTRRYDLRAGGNELRYARDRRLRHAAG